MTETKSEDSEQLKNAKETARSCVEELVEHQILVQIPSVDSRERLAMEANPKKKLRLECDKFMVNGPFNAAKLSTWKGLSSLPDSVKQSCGPISSATWRLRRKCLQVLAFSCNRVSARSLPVCVSGHTARQMPVAVKSSFGGMGAASTKQSIIICKRGNNWYLPTSSSKWNIPSVLQISTPEEDFTAAGICLAVRPETQTGKLFAETRLQLKESAASSTWGALTSYIKMLFKKSRHMNQLSASEIRRYYMNETLKKNYIQTASLSISSLSEINSKGDKGKVGALTVQPTACRSSSAGEECWTWAAISRKLSSGNVPGSQHKMLV
ncbi:hypothetical protein SELMODRAFT_418478 [Selaginella moellendorffii]|uniref:Uncharacterized protein n=1 Tax=Selaginella moellendorffii TaxID=88036 RepID=D8S5U6_SELML|nr:hypothetical protein SELMODRAFT_418478 [Selaginella moellendorffii]